MGRLGPGVVGAVWVGQAGLWVPLLVAVSQLWVVSGWVQLGAPAAHTAEWFFGEALPA